MPEPQPAVLDTCVLVGSRLRDFLLSLAAERAYRPVWNDVILAELAYHETFRHQRHGISKTKATAIADRLITQMDSAFDDSMVQGWEPLQSTFNLPDPNDEHVLATAVTAGAPVIVTDNLRDFPNRVMPSGVTAQSPADFTARIARTNPQAALTALITMSRRLRRPPMTPAEVLDYLASHNGLTQTATLLHAELETSPPHPGA